MQNLQFPQNAAQLKDRLIEQGLDLSKWGQDSAKSAADLWHEIVCGEVTLSFSPPLRRLRVVTVNVKRGSLMLTELEQHFRDGRTRVRRLPPSEKIKANETYRDAAIRCLQEELDVLPEHVLLLGQQPSRD